MARKSKRQKAIKRLNLSDHTLDINIRRCNYNKFSFSEIEEYVSDLVGSRDYQYDAIKQVMIYLWGGGYKRITELGKENYKQKLQIQRRFGTEENFLRQLPLPDRLSGVVHMATGTGKSYVIFAIAYLSLVMGLTKRVLVLGPASTIIEQGLREKFKELKNKIEFNNKLPQRYRGKAINLLTDNDPIEDDSIVIENINAVYTFGSITDTLFKNTGEVLVLGDEIHHAYSHLKYADNRLVLDKEEGPEGKKSEARDERLWMRFLQENSKITRHIGFTGTPYNQNEYFADIIFNYSINDATEEKYIKKINSIIRTETDEGDDRLTIDQRFEMVLKNHQENREKYAYKTRSGKRIVKPITIFICPTQKNAQKRNEEFIAFLTRYMKKHNGIQGTDSEIMDVLRKKVICVVSRVSKSEYKQELDNIEETDPKKIGGSVVVNDRYPEEDEIGQVILEAMKEAGIKGNRLSENNRQQIDNYFNQFLSRGKKKRVFENIEGDLIPVDTVEKMDRTGIRVSELERDRTAFLSEDYETEVGETNKFVLEYINELRGRPEDKQQLSLFKPEDFVESKDEIIRTFVKGDTRPPYVVNTSKLKSPQNIVIVSHSPEKEFVFQLIDNSDYIASWIKSPDKNFYSIDFEYWKGGKDRVRRSFNPDFFIKIYLDEYISRLESEGKQDHVEKLRKLQDQGVGILIKVVEIKSDEEQDEATPAKEDYAKAHFERVNKKLSALNLADLESRYRSDAKHYYSFDLLTPHHFPGWIADLKKGKLGTVKGTGLFL